MFPIAKRMRQLSTLGLRTSDKLLTTLYGRHPYKLRYRRSYLQSLLERSGKRSNDSKPDLVFVLPEKSRGWILEAICREIEACYWGSCLYGYDLSDLPPGRAYFVAHYSFAPDALAHNPHLWGRPVVALYTHSRPLGWSEQELIYVLNACTKIVCMCTLFRRELQERGVQPKKLTTALVGCHPGIFLPHKRDGRGKVGFCAAYYPRKDPERMLGIIRSMPHRNFLLMGRGWDKCALLNEMLQHPNFSYREGSYNEYPHFYNELDVFVSPSRLEGGPIPLLESMMCNVVPVCSRTGMAPDIVRHGENGFLFDLDAEVEEVCDLIDRACKLDSDVRATVRHLTWDRFSRQVLDCLSLGGVS